MKAQMIAAVPLFASLAFGHGVILAAKGPNSKVASVGMQVVLSLARNCTTISPCQQDTTLIRDAEISSNIVNECGRTELAGNIDIGENTENQLAAQQVADVNAGETVDVTIHQVNADGAGPYTCDLEQTGNTGVFEFKNLSITNNVPGARGFSQAKEEDFTMKVQLPDTMNCTGSSQGNVCTLRCRNNALAGPFGGCVALQQKDGGGRVSDDPANVATNLTLDGVLKQVAVDQLDLNAAIAANQQAGTDSADQGVKAVVALLSTAGLDTAVSGPTSIAAPIAGATAATTAAAAQATSANANGNGNANNNANGKGNGNANANANNNNNNNNNNKNKNNNANGNANANANNNANANANGNANGRGNRNNNANANANANNNN